MFCRALDSALMPPGGATCIGPVEDGQKTQIAISASVNDLKKMTSEHRLTFLQMVGRAPGQKITGPNEGVPEQDTPGNRFR